jgi:hypothetical protein
MSLIDTEIENYKTNIGALEWQQNMQQDTLTPLSKGDVRNLNFIKLKESFAVKEKERIERSFRRRNSIIKKERRSKLMGTRTLNVQDLNDLELL